MRHLIVIALALLLSLQVAAQNIDDGWKAIERGDYLQARTLAWVDVNSGRTPPSGGGGGG